MVASVGLSISSSAQATSLTEMDIAALSGVKIGVKTAGLIRVSQASLVSAGLDANVDPRRLSLFLNAVEQPINIVGESDGHFDSGDVLEFYGVGIDDYWTDTRIYFLAEGDGQGLRMPVSTPPEGMLVPSDNFPYTVERHDVLYHVGGLLNGDGPNFFGAIIKDVPANVVLSLHDIDASATATLHVSAQGATFGAHSVSVNLNGTTVGTMSFFDQSLGQISATVGNLIEGNNTITLQAPSSSDVSLVASVSADFGHTYVAENDALRCTAEGGTHLTVDGFDESQIRVFDITSVLTEIIGSVAVSGAGDSVTFDVPGTGTHTLWVASSSAIAPPESLTLNKPSTWNQPHSAELLIISHPSFISSLAPLVALRRSQGWTVEVVDVADVYDEFGDGTETVNAVKDFINHARQTWTIAPRFVLFVGDASFDPRGYLNLGKYDFVPSRLIDTNYQETVSDDWFVDFDNDNLPDLAIGRISVRTAAEADLVVSKIVGYQPDMSHGGLFVADAYDSTDDLDFEAPSVASEGAVSSVMPIDQFFRGEVDSSTATASLVTKLDTGPFLVNYLGHGSVEEWLSLFYDANATSLTNTNLSIYVLMNCLNGFFADVYTNSLAETLVKAPNGGAVAAWASSTLTEPDQQDTMNYQFLSNLAAHMSLGEAAVAAKKTITDPDIRRTWILFGDPTLLGTPQSSTLTDGGTAADMAMTIDGGDTDGGVGGSGLDMSVGGSGDKYRLTGGGCGCDLAHSESPTSALLIIGLALLFYLRTRMRFRS